VARPSGEVVAGNTRLKAAQSLGLTEVPVAWFEGSDLDATAYRIADNKTADLATWDDRSLAALLEAFRAEDALAGVGLLQRRAGLYAVVACAQVDASGPPERVARDAGPGAARAPVTASHVWEFSAP
jgi:ParB-like chromosome segregation protein Spo0J